MNPVVLRGLLVAAIRTLLVGFLFGFGFVQNGISNASAALLGGVYSNSLLAGYVALRGGKIVWAAPLLAIDAYTICWALNTPLLIGPVWGPSVQRIPFLLATFVLSFLLSCVGGVRGPRASNAGRVIAGSYLALGVVIVLLFGAGRSGWAAVGAEGVAAATGIPTSCLAHSTCGRRIAVDVALVDGRRVYRIGRSTVVVQRSGELLRVRGNCGMGCLGISECVVCRRIVDDIARLLLLYFMAVVGVAACSWISANRESSADVGNSRG